MQRDKLRPQIIELMNKSSNDYHQSKLISQQIDDLLGLQSQAVEKSIIQQENTRHFSELGLDKQLWVGLDIQGLQTPYCEILEMLKLVKPKKGEHWIDLGAGYGRMGFLIGMMYPEIKFTGFEYVLQRVEEGQRIIKFWDMINVDLVCRDIASSDAFFPMADVFFIYDFGTQKDIQQCLEVLKQIARQKKITVIARGRGVRNWIFQSHPWLFTEQEAENFENWSLFRT